MTTKTMKKTTLRDILKGCNLIVADTGGTDQRCWAGRLATDEMMDWKFKVTKTRLHLIEVSTNRLQYSFELDREIRFKGAFVSLDHVDGEQACSESIKCQFFSVHNLYK